MSEAIPIELLPEAELLEFTRRQRWFGSKGQEVAGLRLLDRAEVRGEAPVLVDALVEIRYGSGTHDVYQLIVGMRPWDENPGEAIASADGWTSYEAFTDPIFARELVDRLQASSMLGAGEGTVEYCSIAGFPLPEPEEVHVLGVEQTNSSVVLDDRLIVKAYRRIEAGINPELELLHFLGRHDFENVPKLWGWWSYAGPLMSASLGVVQEFVPDAVDGWTVAMEELGCNPDRFLARVRRLGEVVGALHATLASDSEDPAFAPEEASQESLALLVATVDEQIDHVFQHLPDNPAVAPIAGRGDAVRHLLKSLAGVGTIGRRIRHHGDLHLGQMLWSGGDWVVIDFEGEPARSLAERRAKRSPLRDVAGMLRSFSYATSVAGSGDRDVEARARAEFLAGYLGAVESSGLLPAPETTERLLRIFELEKAIYELRYELANRPDWVHVPVGGIVRLLEASTDG
jgi:maltokinase